MATVSGTFSADGVSTALRLRKLREDVQFDVTGPFHGTLQLERARSRNPEGAWETIAGPWTSRALSQTGTLGLRARDVLRMRALDLPTNIIEQGDFAAATGWTAGSGWTIGSGVATGSTASTDLERTCDIPLIEGASYSVTFTTTRSAGSVVVKLGGTSGTSRSTADTFTETIVAGSGQLLEFTGTGFTGTIDDIVIVPVVSYSFNDTDAILDRIINANGESLVVFRESGVEITGDLTVSGAMTAGDVVEAGQVMTVSAGAKVGGTSGWVVGAANDLGTLATMPAGETAGTLVVPITGLEEGDTITGFSVLGQLESGGNAATLDADLRKLTAAAGDLTDASVASITQISETSDAIVNASKVLSSGEVVGADETFYVLLTGTTAASTDIALQAVKVTVTKG